MAEFGVNVKYKVVGVNKEALARTRNLRRVYQGLKTGLTREKVDELNPTLVGSSITVYDYLDMRFGLNNIEWRGDLLVDTT